MAKSSSDVNKVTVSRTGNFSSCVAHIPSNALLFIMGCVCAHYLYQKCKKVTNGDTQPCQLLPAPFYENLQLKSMKTDEQEVELEENVAYGHF